MLLSVLFCAIPGRRSKPTPKEKFQVQTVTGPTLRRGVAKKMLIAGECEGFRESAIPAEAGR